MDWVNGATCGVIGLVAWGVACVFGVLSLREARKAARYNAQAAEDWRKVAEIRAQRLTDRDYVG